VKADFVFLFLLPTAALTFRVKPHMFKVFFLIFEPGVAWERIALARRGFVFILSTYLLPMILLGTAAEGWGLMTWGKWQPKFQKIREFTDHAAVSSAGKYREIIGFEIVQTVLLILLVLVSALLLLRVSQTFHGRHTYLEAFTTIAYGFSPLFLLRLLDAGPMMSPWTTWGIGVGLTIWILYQGIPRVMQPDPTHAFGLYLSAMFVVVLTSGMARLITGMYLLGYIDFNHSWLTSKLGSFIGH
jgi:hypothetical protein